jgi:ubiquinone/menaquinone biosynthesis C-methylase UbiE
MAMALVVSACGGDEAARAYDHYRRPDLLISALGIQPGARLADVGAGQGYLTHRLARAAGRKGCVVATDVDAGALAHIARSAGGEAPVETRVVQADDPGLEAGEYDLILLAQVDHLLGDRASYLDRLARALKPGGRIAITNRRLYRAPLVEAAGHARFAVAGEYDGLPSHFLVFLERK